MFFFEKKNQKTFGHGLGRIMVTRQLAAASIIACLVFLSVAHAEVPDFDVRFSCAAPIA